MLLMVIVTTASIVVAIVASLIAWRVVRDDRRRSDARVAALAADIHGTTANDAADLTLNDAPHVAVDQLFTNAAVETEARRPRFAAIIGGGALVVGSVAVLLVLLTSGARPAASGPGVRAAAKATVAPATAVPPLELVALGHERENDRLTVRGVVRNPAGGREITNLTAVVLLFNQQGGFLTSGRATIDAALAPGGQAPFVVTVPGAAEVGRYRVSFRTEAGIVPHVDRRG